MVDGWFHPQSRFGVLNLELCSVTHWSKIRLCIASNGSPEKEAVWLLCAQFLGLVIKTWVCTYLVIDYWFMPFFP